MRGYTIPKKKPKLQSVIVIPDKPVQETKWHPKARADSNLGCKKFRFTPYHRPGQHSWAQRSPSKSPPKFTNKIVNITSTSTQVAPETTETSTQTEIESNTQPRNKKRKCYRCKGRHLIAQCPLKQPELNQLVMPLEVPLINLPAVAGFSNEFIKESQPDTSSPVNTTPTDCDDQVLDTELTEEEIQTFFTVILSDPVEQSSIEF